MTKNNGSGFTKACVMNIIKEKKNLKATPQYYTIEYIRTLKQTL